MIEPAPPTPTPSPAALRSLEATFETPEAEHSACPFWFWNGDLDPDELLRQLRLMFDAGVRAFVIHARKGLTVEYLSETWFARCELVIEEAARLGMKLWMYDEDNWPSGYAGGRVTARDARFVGQNIALERHYLEREGGTEPMFRLEIARPDEVRGVYACRLESVQFIEPDPLETPPTTPAPPHWSDQYRHYHVYAAEVPTVLEPSGSRLEWRVPEGRWCLMIARQRATDWTAAYSNSPYIDLLNDGATNAFIEETHERYWRRLAPHFGETILGFFVDEPGFYNNFYDRDLGSLTWTHDFAQAFLERRGHDLMARLPELWESLGASTERLRFDYWRTLTELARERFFSKIADWCEAHGVQLTGHLNTEEFLFSSVRNAGNPFEALGAMHVPGVDKIDEVSDKLSEKLAASAAHIHGRRRVISESFALIGWKLAPPYMKRIVDHQFVRGVNWLSPHGFYYSTEGFRRRECPPSEFFQNPWWDHSGPLWAYVARLSSLLSQGVHAAPVALYYPLETAWTTMTPEHPRAMPPGGLWEPWQLDEPHHPTQRADRAMIDLGNRLLERQLDFDLVDHAALERAKVRDGELLVGDERFRALVLPAARSLTSAALARLLEFARSGGMVLFAQVLPERIADGADSPEWLELRPLLKGSPLEALPWGAGQVLYAPDGADAAVAALEPWVVRDLELEFEGDHAPIVTNLESRSPMARETRIRRAGQAFKYHRRVVDGANVYFLVNESDAVLRTRLRLEGTGAAEGWDAATGERHALAARQVAANRVEVALKFQPWQSRLVVLRPGEAQRPDTTWREVERIPLETWSLTLEGRVWDGRLRSWHELGAVFVSGRGVYRTRLSYPRLEPGERLTLDLGAVLETATVSVNGRRAATLAWGPYEADLTDALMEGENELEIEVANTNANAFERQERPSGLIGPVRLVRWARA